MSDEERRNLEYWLATHEKAARFFEKHGNRPSAWQQREAAGRVRVELGRVDWRRAA